MININALCQYCFLPADKTKPFCPYCGNDPARIPERGERCLPQNSVLVGRYLIGRVLGEGGFGITYLALDMFSEKRAAVKEFFPDHLASRDSVNLNQNNITIRTGDATLYFQKGLRSFRQEAETLQKFNRLPGIVSISDFFAENNTAYFVMDYIDGISMKQYLRRYINETGRPLPYTKAFAFMRPVLQSLEMVHEAGIIHRDISPENILIDRNGQVTLIDFGSARAERLVKENLSMTVMVKHGYAPEEQYRTHGNQGAWTDVYAVSTTLYHMISGIRPEDAIERLINDRVVPLKNLPADKTAIPVPQQYSDIIEKGMQPRAENRYQTLDEMLTDLDIADRQSREWQTGTQPGNRTPKEGWSGQQGKKPAYDKDLSRERKRNIAAVILGAVLFISAGTILFTHYINNRPAVSKAEFAGSSDDGESAIAQEDNSGETLRITQQPEDVEASPGEMTYFHVEADGDDVSYQWEYYGPNEVWEESMLPGSRTDTLESKAAAEKNGYQYRCIITDAGGETISSDPATLTVTAETRAIQADFSEQEEKEHTAYRDISEEGGGAGRTNDSTTENTAPLDPGSELRIIQQPEDVEAAVGERARFHVEAAGEDITYQWEYYHTRKEAWRKSTLSGNRTDTLEVLVQTIKSEGQYRCVITDAAGETIISDPAALTVKTGVQTNTEDNSRPESELRIIQQPEDVEAAVGERARFHVEAAGEDITYQWEYYHTRKEAWRESTLSGNRTDTLEVLVQTSKSEGQYRCVITDAAGETIISDPAALTVKTEAQANTEDNSRQTGEETNAGLSEKDERSEAEEERYRSETGHYSLIIPEGFTRNASQDEQDLEVFTGSGSDNFNVGFTDNMGITEQMLAGFGDSFLDGMIEQYINSGIPEDSIEREGAFTTEDNDRTWIGLRINASDLQVHQCITCGGGYLFYISFTDMDAADEAVVLQSFDAE